MCPFACSCCCTHCIPLLLLLLTDYCTGTARDGERARPRKCATKNLRDCATENVHDGECFGAVGGGKQLLPGTGLYCAVHGGLLFDCLILMCVCAPLLALAVVLLYSLHSIALAIVDGLLHRNGARRRARERARPRTCATEIKLRPRTCADRELARLAIILQSNMSNREHAVSLSNLLWEAVEDMRGRGRRR
jgi:hypothetical protein